MSLSKRFNEWEKEIRQYCEENGLDFEKAKKLSKADNTTMLVLQYFD